ncbi:hypothetical protein J2S10_001408 [Neobacillus ginsengisoli]|uniref:Uncharacterized protein n=1 Tax=Neobacillus ginsengisoli TaxID=904295 RepID=A0ABT9XTK8_9BACI|nr:hypothetical protein [Neobacillus ginsengisoli]
MFQMIAQILSHINNRFEHIFLALEIRIILMLPFYKLPHTKRVISYLE